MDAHNLSELRLMVISCITLFALEYRGSGERVGAAAVDAAECICWKIETKSLGRDGRPALVFLRSDTHPQCPLGHNLRTRDPGFSGLNPRKNFKPSETWKVGYCRRDGQEESELRVTFQNVATNEFLSITADGNVHTAADPHPFFMVVSKRAASKKQTMQLLWGMVPRVAKALTSGGDLDASGVRLAAFVERHLPVTPDRAIRTSDDRTWWVE